MAMAPIATVIACGTEDSAVTLNSFSKGLASADFSGLVKTYEAKDITVEEVLTIIEAKTGYSGLSASDKLKISSTNVTVAADSTTATTLVITLRPAITGETGNTTINVSGFAAAGEGTVRDTIVEGTLASVDGVAAMPVAVTVNSAYTLAVTNAEAVTLVANAGTELADLLASLVTMFTVTSSDDSITSITAAWTDTLAATMGDYVVTLTSTNMDTVTVTLNVAAIAKTDVAAPTVASATGVAGANVATAAAGFPLATSDYTVAYAKGGTAATDPADVSGDADWTTSTAGVYTAVYTLTAPTTTQWTGGDSMPMTLTITVAAAAKSNIVVPTVGAATGVAGANVATATAGFPLATSDYTVAYAKGGTAATDPADVSGDADWTTSTAGTYTAVYTLTAPTTTQWTGGDSMPMTLTITIT